MAEQAQSIEKASTEALQTGTDRQHALPLEKLEGLQSSLTTETTGLLSLEATPSNLLADTRDGTAGTASTETESQGQNAKIESEAEKASKPAGKETVEEENATDSDSDSNSGQEDEPETTPRAPVEYAEFTVPDGLTIDETGLTQFKSFAKEQDLTQEQAQKVLEFGGTQLKERLEAPYKLWNETQKTWQAEVKADPEIGGTKFEQSIKDASLVFVAGESNPFVKSAEEAQKLREALNTTGAGNNPEVVKLFVKMGRLLAEPGSLTGKPTAVDKQGDFLAKMYPAMEGEQK